MYLVYDELRDQVLESVDPTRLTMYEDDYTTYVFECHNEGIVPDDFLTFVSELEEDRLALCRV